MYKDTQYESRINEKNLLPWQPMDERFSLIKQRSERSPRTILCTWCPFETVREQ